MKKVILFILSLTLIIIPKVYATCNDKDLNDWVSSKATITFKEGTDAILCDETTKKYEYLKEFAYGLTIPYSDNIVVKYTSTDDKKETILKHDITNDTYIITSSIHYYEKNYKINIYGSSTSACPNELLKTLTYTVPSYNNYHDTEYCTNNPTDEICQMNYDSKDMDDDIFEKYVNSKTEEEEKELSLKDKVILYIKSYWYCVVVPILIISIIYIIKIKKVKKMEDKR